MLLTVFACTDFVPAKHVAGSLCGAVFCSSCFSVATVGPLLLGYAGWCLQMPALGVLVSAVWAWLLYFIVAALWVGGWGDVPGQMLLGTGWFFASGVLMRWCTLVSLVFSLASTFSLLVVWLSRLLSIQRALSHAGALLVSFLCKVCAVHFSFFSFLYNCILLPRHDSECFEDVFVCDDVLGSAFVCCATGAETAAAPASPPQTADALCTC
jgi:hypothetical protein